MMHARTTQGFTLVELILVIAILGILTTMGVVMFGRINNAWTLTRNRTELDAKAEYALDQIRQDLTDLVSPALTGAPLQGADAAVPDAAFPGANAASDTSPSGARPGGRQMLAAANTPFRPRAAPACDTHQTGVRRNPETAPPATVAEGVAQFNVQFLGPDVMAGCLGDRGAPAAVGCPGSSKS